MKISTLIVDDEPIAREGLSDYTAKIDFLDVRAVCKNAIEANSELQKHRIDLVFLDIRLPELSGLDWLRSLSTPPATIITTAYRDFAVDGFDLEVVDYLVKPISFQRFVKACNKAAKIFDGRANTTAFHEVSSTDADSFFIKQDHQYLKINFDDILFIEGLKDYAAIHTQNKKYLVLISLKNVEGKLPQSKFLRVHRSFIVALSKIDAVEGNILKFGNKDVPISREMQEPLYSLLLKNRVWKREY